MFADAVSAIFASEIAETGLYKAGGDGPGTAVRVIRAQPDDRGSFGQTAVVTETAVLTMLRAEVQAPQAGDVVVLSGESWRIKGAPASTDPLRLEWRCEVMPVA